MAKNFKKDYKEKKSPHCYLKFWVILYQDLWWNYHENAGNKVAFSITTG